MNMIVFLFDHVFLQEKLRTFARERQLRLQAERQRDEIERQFVDYQEQMKQIHETLVSRIEPTT
jgi:hypothetical protein